MMRGRVTLYDIRSAGFRQWIKVCLVVAVHLGFAFGFCTLILALAGGSAYADVFGLRFSGVVAGLVNLVWSPLLALIASVPLSAIAWWPFRWSSGLLSSDARGPIATE